MEPVLAQAFATLIGAIATAILLAASHYWGPSQRQVRADRDERRAADDKYSHDQERSGGHETDVSKDRDYLRKRREELEKKALVPVEKPPEGATAPVAQKEPALPAKPDATSNAAWKQGMRKKIALGTGVALLSFVVVSNLSLLIVCGAVVGGVYYFSGKYLGDETETKESTDEKKS